MAAKCDGCGHMVDRFTVRFIVPRKPKKTHQAKPAKLLTVTTCKKCLRNPPTKVCTFPFTMDFGLDNSGKRLTINSLYDLRRVERKYRVESVAYNQNEGNWDPPQSKAQPFADVSFGPKEGGMYDRQV